VILRAYEPRDREAVMALFYASDERLAVLDPSHPANPVTVVMEDEGRIVAALVGRIKLDVYLALDHKAGSPRERLDWIRALAEYGIEGMEAIGAPDIEFAALPEHRSWIKRIEQLPFAVRDERVHFKLRKEAQHGQLQHGGSGDGAAWTGSSAADERAGRRPAADPEPGLAADPSEHAWVRSGAERADRDPQQAVGRGTVA
jgi:hypothetical protein